MPTARRSPFVESRNGRLRVRWPGSDGKLDGASCDDNGNPFPDKAAAMLYGWEQIGKLNRGEWRDPAGGDVTVQEWIPDWWSRNDMEDLTFETKRTYRWAIEVVILPRWAHRTLASLAQAEGELADWKRELRKEYSEKSINIAYGLFTTMLSDAYAARLMTSDPTVQARTQKRRGRRRRDRGHGEAAEKAWATPMQALLIAERSALLSRRDDEFILVITKAYTGMRWSELNGLERQYVRSDTTRGDTVRVEWQLQRQGNRWVRNAPKDESRRTIDVPPFLADLLAIQTASGTGRCSCPDHRSARYVWLTPKGAHRHRSSFDNNVFGPAVEGWWPAGRNKQNERRPVLLHATPWPGIPVRGQAPEKRADACWMPVLPAGTPHSLRHGHRTWLIEARVEEVLQHERFGHELAGMRGIYSHVSPQMRERLKQVLTQLWEKSLAERYAVSPSSPVPVLDGLLKAHAKQEGKLCSQSAPILDLGACQARQQNTG